MRLAIALLLLLGFGISLLLNAPATLLDRVLQHYSQGQLRLAEASGSLWSGQAVPLFITAQQQQVVLPRLQWQFEWTELGQGQLPIKLQWQHNSSPTWLLISPQRINIQQLKLNLPARILSEIAPLLKPIQLSGQLQLNSQQLEFKAGEIHGQATLLWQQASSRLSPVMPLGNYQLQLQGQGSQLDIQLSTQDGALQLEGKGHWQAGNKLNFNGTARAHPDYESSLQELLNNLGPRLAPGVHRISLM